MSAVRMIRITTREQLDGALARRKTMSHLRLGDALVQENLITAGQRDAALAVQAGDPRKLLGEILVADGAVTREKLRQVLAEQLGVPTVNLAHFECEPDAIGAVAPEVARRHMVMPLYRTGTRIAVGIENPLSWEALQELERSTQLKVDPAMASHEDLVAAVARAYGAGALLGHATCGTIALNAESSGRPANDDLPAFESDLLALARGLVGRAHAKGTLSIHAEAVAGGAPGAMSFRVEGLLDS